MMSLLFVFNIMCTKFSRFVNIPIDQEKRKCQTLDKRGCSLYIFQRALFGGIFLIFWEIIKKYKFVFCERYVRFSFWKKNHYVQLAYGVCFEIGCISSGVFQMVKCFKKKVT